ncbi:FecR family protein [Mucilaginibacter litoreus]|uniref:FecR family protein n=1 Tax=Mucilaginibacter litoreus TaxID=1048221 RepID=A0ABW3ASM1_9SPHI
MRKFTFLRKKIEAKDRVLQEKLVNEYFNKLELGGRSAKDQNADFDHAAVYQRITTAINQTPEKKVASNKKWVVAASLIVLIAVTGITYKYRTTILDVVSPIAKIEITTSKGQIASLTLADGTKVWINGESKLTYPEEFRGEKREVQLTGEAFFDVAHDANKAFIVNTGSIKTHVLGTSFNVKAYKDEDYIKVDVASGKVGVVAPSVKTVYLTPKQEAVIDKNNYAAIKNHGVDMGVLTSWRDGSFIVKNMPLPEVLSAIQRRFGIKIKADDNLVNCSITANFTNVSFENVMKIVSKLVKGRTIAVDNGNSYQLRGKGC